MVTRSITSSSVLNRNDEVDVSTLPVTDPRHPDYVYPPLLTRDGFAGYLVEARDNNFTKFPNSAIRDWGIIRSSIGDWILNDDKFQPREFAPAKAKLTRDVYFYTGPFSTRTTDKITKIKGTRKDDYMLGGVNGEKMIGGDGDDFLIGGIGKDVLVGGKGNDYFWGGIGSDKYKNLQGDDYFINFDLYGNSDVIVDKLKNVEIVGRGPYEFDSTLVTHQKGSIVISGWEPDEIAEADIF